jgi:DhnA family fructose-bisphosphate aldolase class Ia
MAKQTGLIRAMMTKKRVLSADDKVAINRAGQQNMIQEIQEIESRAHALGMHVTAHALNRAKNALGWEIAGDAEQAGKAALRK